MSSPLDDGTRTPDTSPMPRPGFEPGTLSLEARDDLRFTTEAVDAPTRTRTRDSSLGPRCDPPLHHRGQERKARDSNPHSPRGETALAGRLGKPYPTTFRSSGPTGSRTRVSGLPSRR